MSISIATWNINSVRLRMPIVSDFLKRQKPDILCLQETKTPDEFFPREHFEKLGYKHIALHGQKGYHGVAIVSRKPFASLSKDRFCGKDDARHLAVKFERGNGLRESFTLHNFYIPAGGDEPDPQVNPKFAHKLSFLDELGGCPANLEAAKGGNAILVGDLNVAPLENDVWSHKQMLRVVSHTPVEVEKFTRAQEKGGWIDVMRGFVPEPKKLYTWWSYRAQDWAVSDRGRRLDHVWASASLKGAANKMKILRDARGWERPSDHVPVIVNFDL
jgi:exodeoxyribonuclease-3